MVRYSLLMACILCSAYITMQPSCMEREIKSSSKHAHVFTLAGLEVVSIIKNSICRSLLDIVGCDAV